MALDLINLAYPFDPTGERIANKVVGEQHILRGAENHDFYFIIPQSAPYFASSLVAILSNNDGSKRELLYGVDYYPSHWFISASRACAKPIYGSITIINRKLTGIVTLTYQTLGGIWTQSEQKIAELLADRVNNPRNTSWDVVIDMPVSFPPIDHVWDYDDMVGQKEMVAGINAIETALRTTGSGGIAAHLVDFQNPHKVTALQVGLGAVRNLRTATPAEGVAGTSDDLYMTPRSVASAITAQALGPLANHANDNGNPHHTTAAQAGTYDYNEINTLLLAKVDKNGVAYDSNRFGGMLPAEYRANVLTGTAANSSKFGGLSPTEFIAQIQLEGTTNALRFGGYTVEEFLATQTINNSVKLAGQNLTQLTDSIRNGKVADSFKLEGKTVAEIMAGQSGSTATFGGQSALEFKSEIIAGTVNNANRFGGLTPAEFIAQMSGSTGNALKFGGMDVDQYKVFALDGTATNATKFANMTANEWVSSNNNSYMPRATGTYRGQSAGLDIAALGSYWVPLGEFDMPKVGSWYIDGDAFWLVTGGEDAMVGKKSPTHSVRIKAGLVGGVATVNAAAVPMGDSQEVPIFGYSVDGTGVDSVVTIWRQVSNRSTSVSVVELSKGNAVMRVDRAPAQVKPVGFTQIPITEGASAAVEELRAEVEATLVAMTAAFTSLAQQLS